MFKFRSDLSLNLYKFKPFLHQKYSSFSLLLNQTDLVYDFCSCFICCSSKNFKGQLNLILAADQLDTSIVTKPDIGSRSGSFNFVNWSGRKMQCDGDRRKCHLVSVQLQGELQLTFSLLDFR